MPALVQGLSNSELKTPTKKQTISSSGLKTPTTKQSPALGSKHQPTNKQSPALGSKHQPTNKQSPALHEGVFCSSIEFTGHHRYMDSQRRLEHDPCLFLGVDRGDPFVWVVKLFIVLHCHIGDHHRREEFSTSFGGCRKLKETVPV